MASVATMKYFVVSSALPGPIRKSSRWMVAADGGDHQDRVRLLRVERAVRHVGDREVLDDLSALQREVADLVLLMRRLVRGDERPHGGVDTAIAATAAASATMRIGRTSCGQAGQRVAQRRRASIDIE
jgi:hypothetical protein